MLDEALTRVSAASKTLHSQQFPTLLAGAIRASGDRKREKKIRTSVKPRTRWRANGAADGGRWSDFAS